ncbi:uncharacterized protein LOC135174204 [Pogoniulus pusillus]|uniref:uncharacterized protein LOC135174204 n=1 Tax=Pogoniulus pusillus TaxID=488313 RepID=UPI0030B9989E
MAGRGPAPPAALIGCGCPAGGGTSAPARAPLPPLAHVAAAAAEQRSAPQALSSPGRQVPAGAGARHRPVRGALPRPPLCAPRVCQLIRQLEDQAVIEKAHSPFNSPIWPVRKPNGDWRLTVDFRALDEVTPPMSAAVPDMLNL